MLVFSLAEAPLSVSHDATRAVNLLYLSPSYVGVKKDKPELAMYHPFMDML